MIDSHCHLNFHAFENDYENVIKRAKEAGVHTIINTGTSITSSAWAVELAEKYDNLYAVVGIHPHHADKVTSEGRHLEIVEGSTWLEQFETIARHPKVIGVGEIGMDFHNYQSNGIVDPQVQKRIFITQLELAHTLKLPLQIHSRNEEARKEIITILKTHKNLLQPNPGMFHCMAGSLESLKETLHLGFSVGFDGNSMYEGLPPDEPLPLTDLIKVTPLDRIVVETDSPYLAPLPHRGKRNEPAYAIIVAQFLAKIKNVTFEELVEQTDKNVYNIFTKLA
ncbi:MAG TPA: TatD family hydrolase [Patescibacteria group bacterium]|nr:TatD family hydrolase [Patescibacteria group bacterium]